MALPALPTPPSRSDPINFASRADTFFAALPAWVTAFNAMVPAAVAGSVTGSFSVSDNITYGGTLTGDVGIVNLGIGQIYKDVSGNVGFGNTTPATYGRIAVTHASVGPVVAVGITSGGAGNNLVGTVLFPNGYGVTNSAQIKAWCGSTSLHSFLSFDVSGTEALRIDQSRNLLIGYTTSNGSYSLQVNSQIFATSSTVATSDGRYKTAVEDITDALGIVNALRPVSFEWLPHQVHNFPAGRTTGFIAQEVQEALAGKPYADAIVKVNATTLPDGTDEEFLGIAEGNLIAILTRAVQELSVRVAALEA